MVAGDADLEDVTCVDAQGFEMRSIQSHAHAPSDLEGLALLNILRPVKAEFARKLLRCLERPTPENLLPALRASKPCRGQFPEWKRDFDDGRVAVDRCFMVWAFDAPSGGSPSR